MKFGSYVRLQTEYNSAAHGQVYGSGDALALGLNSRTDSVSFYNIRAALAVDTRQQTAYGTLRTYFRVGTQDNTPNTVSLGNAALSSLSQQFYVDRAFIQFAGFTAGRTQSFFDTFSYAPYSYIDPRTSGETTLYGVGVMAYTAQLGNGVSTTLSFEEPVPHYRGGVADGTSGAWAINGVVLQDNAKVRMPDIVLNLRLDQAFGSLKLSGALHQVGGGYYGTPAVNPQANPADKFGWAASVGGTLNLPGGDTLSANFVYSQGATGYATAGRNWQMYNGNGVGIGWLMDGLFDGAVAGNTQTEVHLTTAWSANAAYEHIWNANWRTSVYGGYTQISYNAAATTIINGHLPGAAGTRPCGVPVAGAVWPPVNIVAGDGNSCSPNFSFFQVGTRTQWNPVRNLDIGLDLTYTRLNTAYKGSGIGIYPANGVKLATDSITDQNVFSAIMRYQVAIVP